MPAATVTIKVPAREATDIRNICDEPSNNPVLSSNSASGERAYKTTITLLKYFQIVVQKIYFTITSKINDFSCAAAFARKKGTATEKLWEDVICVSSTVFEILEEKAGLHHNCYRQIRPKNMQAVEKVKDKDGENV